MEAKIPGKMPWYGSLLPHIIRIQKHRGQKDGNATAPKFFAEICKSLFKAFVASEISGGDRINSPGAKWANLFATCWLDRVPRSWVSILENYDPDKWPHFVIEREFHLGLALHAVMKSGSLDYPAVGCI